MGDRHGITGRNPERVTRAAATLRTELAAPPQTGVSSVEQIVDERLDAVVAELLAAPRRLRSRVIGRTLFDVCTDLTAGERRVERAVADITASSISPMLGNRLPSDTGTRLPFATAAASPVFDFAAREVDPPSALMHHPILTVQSTPPAPVAGEKTDLSSVKLTAAHGDSVPATVGVAADISRYLDLFDAEPQLASLVESWLVFHAKRSAEGWLAAEIAAGAPTTVADLDTALDTIAAPWTARIAVSTVGKLRAAVPSELRALGIEPVASTMFGSGFVADPLALDVRRTPWVMLGTSDVARIGHTVSISCRVAMSLDPAGVARIA